MSTGAALKPIAPYPESSLPSAAPPMEVRLLSELHAIQSTLVRLTEIMARIAETLERGNHR